MSKIRGKNTRPELIVHRYLRREKIYFQKHYRSRLGMVIDVALPRKKRAVFIDGDFWHGRTFEKVANQRGHDDFWTKKLKRNMERDISQQDLLLSNDWAVMRVWSSDLMKKDTRTKTLDGIAAFLTEDIGLSPICYEC